MMVVGTSSPATIGRKLAPGTTRKAFDKSSWVRVVVVASAAAAARRVGVFSDGVNCNWDQYEFDSGKVPEKCEF